MKKCAFCGTENIDTETFCEFCGYRFNETPLNIVANSKTDRMSTPVVSSFDRGYVTEKLVADSGSKEIVLTDAYVFITSEQLLDIHDILPLLEETAKNGAQLLIIADSFEENVINTLVVNRQRGALICAAVKAPGFGDRRKEMLTDIAILTGGQVIAAGSGLNLHDITLAHCGKAKIIKVTESDTFITEGNGNPERISERITQLKEYVLTIPSLYDKEKTQERLINLFGLPKEDVMC